jgi:hypothetical protein
MEELQHGDLVPCGAVEAHMTRAECRLAVDLDGGLEMTDPVGGESRERAIGRERAVERNSEEAIDDLVAHALHGGIECVGVRDPRVALGEAPPEHLERIAWRTPTCGDRCGVRAAECRALAPPRAELSGDRRLVQQARSVEIVEIVQRVGDIVRDIHDGAFEGLLAGLDLRIRAERVLGVGHVDRIHRELAARGPAAASALVAPPRVFEHRGAHGAREVETDAGAIVLVEPGHDAVRLSVALEALLQTEARAREPIERHLSQVSERRVPDVVSARGRLNDDGVTTAEVLDECPGRARAAVQMHRDRAGDRRDLHRVCEAVVHGETGARLRDHLRHG